MDFIVENALKNKAKNEFQGVEVKQANIKVFGSGGAGNNMVSWLYRKGIKGAEIIAANTDQQHLDISEADRKILMGKDITKGLGCGGYPEKGAEAARESIQDVKDSLKGVDMAFICAGMGGGTGTGSAPVIAKVAKELGSIVIGTVTMPFKIERARVDKAEFGLQQLREVTDTVIVIDNNRLVEIAVPSLVNLDYADVKAIMTNGDVAAIGVGSSGTNNRVEEAVHGALSNPLLDISYKGATGALIHIAGGPDMTLDEVTRVGELVTESMDQDANVIWGARISEDLKGKLTVMTIMTGVKSPWILGKAREQEASVEMQEINDELGIEIVQ